MLSFKNCDFCEREIAPGSPLCPHCGHIQKTGAEWSSHYRALLLAALLSAAVLVIWTALIRPPH